MSNSFLNFHYNRQEYKKNFLKWIELVNVWVDSAEIDPFISHFTQRYELSRESVSQHLKRTIAHWYDFENCKFKRRLKNENIVLASARFFSSLGYLLFFSTTRCAKRKKYDLLIEDIANLQFEKNVFSKLINESGFNAGYVLTQNDPTRDDSTILQPDKKYYERKLILKVFDIEKRFGMRLYRELSKKLNVDMFQLAFSILNQFLYYETLYSQAEASYDLTWRDYGAHSIKRDMFKRMGGKKVGCVQRSRHGYTAMASFMDLDIYFPLGEWYSELNRNLHSFIKQSSPIGSLVAEINLNESKKSNPKTYDLMYVDIPLLDHLNVYQEYNSDHIETYQWLIRFAEEFPNYRVVIKARKKVPLDSRVLEMFQKSKVRILEDELNTYHLASETRVITTFHSTMGFELRAMGMPVVFCNPGERSTLLPDRDDFRIYSANNYDIFKQRALSYLQGEPSSRNMPDFDYYCLSSHGASTKLLKSLLS